MPLSTVSKLIAVSSCKGGVGKSTVALELAYHLRRRGHRVGLFDADVHGPSLPTQIPLGDVRITLAADGRSVQPLTAELPRFDRETNEEPPGSEIHNEPLRACSTERQRSALHAVRSAEGWQLRMG